MNYYIDFDNTLYNTPILTQRMLNSISEIAFYDKNLDKQLIFNECKSMFNREHIYDIYKLAKYFSNKYDLDLTKLTNNINNVILTSSDLVFEDSIPFLKKLQKEKHNIYMLTYSNDNLNYQTAKILGSGIADYFDALYITAQPKYELDIDYTNGIFIDDNPTDLLGLYSKNAKKLIRIRRKGNKYSTIDLNNINIEEYSNFAIGDGDFWQL